MAVQQHTVPLGGDRVTVPALAGPVGAPAPSFPTIVVAARVFEAALLGARR